MSLSVTRSNLVKAEPIEDREVMGNAIVILAMALLIPLVADSMQLFGALKTPSTSFKFFFLNNGEWLFVLPTILVLAVSAWTLRWRGIAIAIGSLIATYAMFINFRGSWIWMGFFDRYQMDTSAWRLPLSMALTLGLAVAAAIASLRKTDRPMPATWITGAVLAVGFASVWAYIEPRMLVPIDSAFPPTRFIPYAFATIILAIAYFWSIQE